MNVLNGQRYKVVTDLAIILGSVVAGFLSGMLMRFRPSKEG